MQGDGTRFMPNHLCLYKKMVSNINNSIRAMWKKKSKVDNVSVGIVVGLRNTKSRRGANVLYLGTGATQPCKYH